MMMIKTKIKKSASVDGSATVFHVEVFQPKTPRERLSSMTRGVFHGINTYF